MHESMDLFNNAYAVPSMAKLQSLNLPKADISFCKGWLPDAGRVFDEIKQQINWQQPSLNLFGRVHKIPRLQAWVGDSGAVYRYSGQTFVPDTWLPRLDEIRRALAELLDAPFNSVLANLYRDGRDGLGWHADNEPELGSTPCIASVSLGAARGFCIKPRDGAGNSTRIELGGGDLLVMRGTTQAHWLHACPKTHKAVGPRISLTFRYIHSADK